MPKKDKTLWYFKDGLHVGSPQSFGDSLTTIVMTFVKNLFKIHENSLKFAKNWVKFTNFKLQNEECHHYVNNPSLNIIWLRGSLSGH
jgi:hypothetical protein